MAMIHTSAHRGGFFSTMSYLLDDLRARAEAYRVAEQTRRELEALSDRELNDLGLSRYDIRHMDLSPKR